MTANTREILKNVQVKLPIRVDEEGNYFFRGDDLIDTLELAIIKSPELKDELRTLIGNIFKGSISIA